MKKIILALAFLTLTISCSHGQSKKVASPSHPLLIISFDGFRYNYFSKVKTPHFDQFISQGVKAKSLIPVFPSMTFPNHYAIATGLYPEHSGIVDNTMYDPKFNAWYRISNKKAVQNPRWYNGEPIWNTVEKQGLKAGVFFWVGSETPIQHMRPAHWKPYDGSVPFKARIDTVVKWLSAPNGKAVNFAALYFSQPDHAGHKYGPQSNSVKAQIVHADNLIGYLKRKMKAANLWNRTNIIIVSDHGMTELSKNKTIPLSKIINLKNLKRHIYGPLTMLQPKKGKEEAMYKALKSHAKHYRIYKKEDVPKRLHYRHNRRIMDLVMVADLGYTIITPSYKKYFLRSLPAGNHGYDPKNMQMHAIFLARGPAFKKGVKVKAFKNINIYDLMCHLLDLKPAANDGSLDNIKMVLKGG